MASTVRIYNPTNDGYKDVTTNDEAVVIRETHYDEGDVVTETMDHDPRSGKTETTTYEEGRKKEKITRGPDGEELEREEYDKEGRVIRKETIEDFVSTVLEFHYDKKGRIIQVDKIGGGGGIEESTQFSYDREGRLWRVGHDKLSAQGMMPESSVEFDEQGEITGADGDTRVLLEWINQLLATEYDDANCHVTTDHHGNRIRVCHNPDGSYDVNVTNRERKLVMRQYYLSGRCYIGDLCPFRVSTP